MERTVGIVIPAFAPEPSQLVHYISALDETINPDAILVELDEPAPSTIESLSNSPATVHVADRRRGKGAAITVGFEKLDTDILAFVDADGSTPVSSFEAILAPVREDSAALAVGSRRHPDSTVPTHQSRFRRRAGDFFVRVARIFLPVTLTDYQCGAKAIRRETWEQIRGSLRSAGFAWDIELISLVAWADEPIVEIPIVWEDQPGSTVPPMQTALAFGRTVYRIWSEGKSRDSRSTRDVKGGSGDSRVPLIEREDLVSTPVGGEYS